MWGKGKKLEIHNNPAQRTMLVRVHSDYLRQKILEKGYWYIGDSMFYAIQWTSLNSSQPPAPKSIQLWAHLTGVPLDLRYQEGLSLVAGLVGEPKETDDFTKNLVSLTLAHVKVELDLTKPAPDVVEFTRESGEVVEVSVTYPWLPPTCSHCKELGHIAKNCLLLPVPHPNPPGEQTAKPTPPTRKNPTKTYVPKQSSKTSSHPPAAPSPNTQIPTPPLPVTSDLNRLPPTVPAKATSSLVPSQLSLAVLPKTHDFSTQSSPPNPRLRQSLKRSRSDPSLSPPNTSFLTSSVTAELPNLSRNSVAPLLLTLPTIVDPNPFSLLVTDSSFSKGESPPSS